LGGGGAATVVASGIETVPGGGNAYVQTGVTSFADDGKTYEVTAAFADDGGAGNLAMYEGQENPSYCTYRLRWDDGEWEININQGPPMDVEVAWAMMEVSL
jgi:hypothetical protein